MGGKLQAARLVRFLRRGKQGLWYEYAGEWGDIASVVNTDAIGYFVKYTYNATGTYGFYMNTLGAGVTNGTTPANSSGVANSGWEKMSDERKFFISRAIFGEYAHFGSAIINGDWMLSTNGSINGVEYNNGALFNSKAAYTYFDPAFPYGKRRLLAFRQNNSETFELSGGKSYRIDIYGDTNSPAYEYVYTLTAPDGSTLYSGTMEDESLVLNITNAAAGEHTLTVAMQLKSGQSGMQVVSFKGSRYKYAYITPVNTFTPVYAVNLLTGATYQGDLTVSGVVDAKAFYSKTIQVTSNYVIDLEEEPAHTYIVQGSDIQILLPKSKFSEGAQFQILLASGSASLNFGGDYLYMKSGDAMVRRGSANDVYTVQYAKHNSVDLTVGSLVTLKAIITDNNGTEECAWWALTGDLTTSMFLAVDVNEGHVIDKVFH